MQNTAIQKRLKRILPAFAALALIVIVTFVLWQSKRDRNVLRGHTGPVYGFAASQEMRLVITGGEDRSVRFWDMNSQTPSNILWGHSEAVVGVAVNRQDGMVASSSMDGTVILWDPITQRDLHILKGHAARVDQVAFPHDSVHDIASGNLACVGNSRVGLPSLSILWVRTTTACHQSAAVSVGRLAAAAD